MWFGIIAAFVLVVLLVLLLAPWRVVCRWNGGLVELYVRFLGMSFTFWKGNIFERSEPEPKRRSARSDKDDRASVSEFIDRIQALIDHRDVLVHTGRLLLQFARRLSGWWHLDHSRIEVVFGLGNPAHTGMALGALSALGGIIGAQWPMMQFAAHPDFDNATLLSRGEVIFRIRAWDPVWDILCALVKAPWRGLWKLKRDLVYP